MTVVVLCRARSYGYVVNVMFMFAALAKPTLDAKRERPSAMYFGPSLTRPRPVDKIPLKQEQHDTLSFFPTR